jgi:hypothetical protein
MASSGITLEVKDIVSDLQAGQKGAEKAHSAYSHDNR